MPASLGRSTIPWFEPRLQSFFPLDPRPAFRPLVHLGGPRPGPSFFKRVFSSVFTLHYARLSFWLERAAPFYPATFSFVTRERERERCVSLSYFYIFRFFYLSLSGFFYIVEQYETWWNGMDKVGRKKGARFNLRQRWKMIATAFLICVPCEGERVLDN